VGFEIHYHTSERSQCSVEHWTVTANSRVSPARAFLDGVKGGCHYHTSHYLDLHTLGGTAHPSFSGNEVHRGVEMERGQS
jgi:hypothetical protein